MVVAAPPPSKKPLDGRVDAEAAPAEGAPVRAGRLPDRVQGRERPHRVVALGRHRAARRADRARRLGLRDQPQRARLPLPARERQAVLEQGAGRDLGAVDRRRSAVRGPPRQECRAAGRRVDRRRTGDRRARQRGGCVPRRRADRHERLEEGVGVRGLATGRAGRREVRGHGRLRAGLGSGERCGAVEAALGGGRGQALARHRRARGRAGGGVDARRADLRSRRRHRLHPVGVRPEEDDRRRAGRGRGLGLRDDHGWHRDRADVADSSLDGWHMWGGNPQHIGPVAAAAR